MINTYDMLRGSGKTTEIIKLLKEDESLYCLVPTYNSKYVFPKELHNRIILVNVNDIEFTFAERRIKNVVLEEGFMYKKDTLAKLYYFLGLKGIDVIAYGTIEN